MICPYQRISKQSEIYCDTFDYKSCDCNYKGDLLTIKDDYYRACKRTHTDQTKDALTEKVNSWGRMIKKWYMGCQDG